MIFDVALNLIFIYICKLYQFWCVMYRLSHLSSMPAHAGRGIADYFFLMQPKWIWIKGIILSNLGTMSVHLSIKFPKHFLNLLMPVRIHHLISFDWHLLCVGENGVPSIFIISFYYIWLYRFLFQEGALLIFSLLPSLLD